MRYIKGTWPKDSAFFDLRSTYKTELLNRDLNGTLNMEFPLTTRHLANVTYSLTGRENIQNGHCVVVYNGKKELDGHYTSKLESRAGYEKEVVKITLDNTIVKPLGISFVHVFQEEGTDKPNHVRVLSFIYHVKIDLPFSAVV